MRDTADRAKRVAGFVALAGAVGVLTVVEPIAAVAVIAGVVLVALSPALVGVVRRNRTGIGAVMLGALGALALTDARSTQELQASLISPVNIIQGFVPAAALAYIVLRYRQRIRLSAAGKWAVAFVGVALASTVWSVDPTATLLKSMQLATIYALIVVFLSRVEIVEVPQLVGTAVQVVLAAVIAQAFLNPNAIAPAGRGAVRLSSFFMAANTVGFTAVLGILSVLTGSGPRIFLRRPALRIAVGVAFVAVLVASRGRSALAVLLIALFTLAAMWPRWRIPLVGFGFATAAAVLASPALAGVLTGFLRRGQDERLIRNLSGRTVNWAASLDIWRESPLLGNGYYAGHRLSGFTEASNLDNAYLEVLLNLGIVGLVCFVMMLLAGLVAAWRHRGPHRQFRVTVVLSVIALGFMNPSLQIVGWSLVLVGPLALMPSAFSSGGVPGRHVRGTEILDRPSGVVADHVAGHRAAP